MNSRPEPAVSARVACAWSQRERLLNSGSCGSGNSRAAASVPSATPRLVGDLRLGAPQGRIGNLRQLCHIRSARRFANLPTLVFADSDRGERIGHEEWRILCVSTISQLHGASRRKRQVATPMNAVAKFVAGLGVALARAGDRLQGGETLGLTVGGRAGVRNEPNGGWVAWRRELSRTMKCDERSQDR